FFGRSRRFEPLLLNAVERTIIAVSDNFPHQRLLQAVRNVLIGGKMWIEIPDVSEVFITNRTHAIDRNIHPVARSEYILTGLARLEGTSECLTLHMLRRFNARHGEHRGRKVNKAYQVGNDCARVTFIRVRSEEHTSELQS